MWFLRYTLEKSQLQVSGASPHPAWLFLRCSSSLTHLQGAEYKGKGKVLSWGWSPPSPGVIVMSDDCMAFLGF